MARPQNKQYNPSIAPFFKAQSGNFFSLRVTPEIFDQLSKVEVGGKLFLRVVSPATKERTGTKVDAYLDAISKDEADRQEADYKANRNSSEEL